MKICVWSRPTRTREEAAARVLHQVLDASGAPEVVLTHFATTVSDAHAEVLRTALREDPRVVLLGEDVGKKGGVFLATDGLFDEFGGDRVLDTPLSESLIIGASIGMALNGLRPVPEIQFADFIFPAFNQILSEAARMRYRSNGAFGLPMAVRAPYGGGVHGALYHSQSVEASILTLRDNFSFSTRVSLSFKAETISRVNSSWTAKISFRSRSEPYPLAANPPQIRKGMSLLLSKSTIHLIAS